MGIVKYILKGQKAFLYDLFAVVDFIALTLAYFLGVGASRIFFKNVVNNLDKKSLWEDFDMDKKNSSSYLKQY